MKLDMKKNDLIIIGIGLLVALLVFAGVEIGKRITTSDSMVVEVHYDGELLETIPLSSEGVYTYEHNHGFNVFEIKDNKARMIEADCPDLSCTRQFPISHNGENIVCLPYKFHLVVVGGEEEVFVDAISK